MLMELRTEFGKYVVVERLALEDKSPNHHSLRNNLYLEDESSLRVVSCGNQKALKPLDSRVEKSY